MSQQLLSSSEAMEAYGAQLAQRISPPCLIFLQGDLGAGKTTLVRGFLCGLGYQGAVKSPTYTLIEPYLIGEISCFHLDLYRLSDIEELEYLGLREIFGPQSVVLIEWPERFEGALPEPDKRLILEYISDGRRVSLVE